MSKPIVLMQSDIFFGVDPEHINKIASISKETRFKDREIIFEENSIGDELYIIAEGEVEIVLDPTLVSDEELSQESPRTIAHLHRGQSFGEVALVDQGLRSATARSANKSTKLLIIPRKELLQLFEEVPELGYCMMKNLAADLALKLRGTDFQIRDKLLQED